jgi:hypothetical protein
LVLRGLTCRFAGVLRGNGAKKDPGLKPLDSIGFIQGLKLLAPSEKGKGGAFVGERGGRSRSGGVHRGSSRSKDALRMTAGTGNDEEQIQRFWLRQNDDFG